MSEEEVDVAQLHAHLRGEHRDERAEGCFACQGLPPVSTRGGTVPKGNATSPSTGRLCQCGCGQPVARRFKPGHDARLKSRLVKDARSGSEAARKQLEEFGWEKFI